MPGEASDICVCASVGGDSSLVKRGVLEPRRDDGPDLESLGEGKGNVRKLFSNAHNATVIVGDSSNVRKSIVASVAR
jgi:hypothetical protein